MVEIRDAFTLLHSASAIFFVFTPIVMLDRLSQSWEQQRQFVNNISHALTIVHGYLQSVLKRETN